MDFYDAVTNSFLIAFFTMIIGTSLGTMAALAWVRYRFKLRQVFQSVNLLPIIFPQLILGIMLLLWFSVLGNAFQFNTGLITVIIGQVVYLTPFAMVVVSVQIHAFDDTLEDAAPRRRGNHLAGLSRRHPATDLAGHLLGSDFRVPAVLGQFLHHVLFERRRPDDPNLRFRGPDTGLDPDLPGARHAGVHPGHHPGRGRGTLPPPGARPPLSRDPVGVISEARLPRVSRPG